MKTSFEYCFFYDDELLLSEVASAEVVQNSRLNGFGVVELKLKSGSVVKIGSDEAEELNDALNVTSTQQKLTGATLVTLNKAKCNTIDTGSMQCR